MREMNIQQLIDMPSDDAAETAARLLTNCPACGTAIEHGHLCCWRCFKHEAPNGAKPLKWSGLGYRDWLKHVTPIST